MNKQATNKVRINDLSYRLAILIANIKPFEQIEIKLDEAGNVVVLVTSKNREVFAVE